MESGQSFPLYAYHAQTVQYSNMIQLEVKNLAQIALTLSHSPRDNQTSFYPLLTNGP